MAWVPLPIVGASDLLDRQIIHVIPGLVSD
jgi:hypothetical protein